MTNAELRALLADTLLVWGEGGHLAWEADALRVTAADGRAALVRRGGPERWTIEAAGRRPRPCASLVALLGALRSAVGPRQQGPALRMVGPPDG